MAAADLSAALHVLQSAARRVSAARRIQTDVEQGLLRTIVEATVTLFDAEASSIALFERDPDRLEFRVAAGPRGAGAVGLSVPPSKGIVGYVYSTGQALALSDVGNDPRFDRATAERTGYVPRSIAAVPLVDGTATVGVLQVLDKKGSATFSLRDMELLAVFARQAAAAINAARVQRDGARLLRAVLRDVGDGDLADDQLDALVTAASEGLDDPEDTPFWSIVDRVARLRDMSDRELRLVASILGAVADQAARAPRRG
jgi:GAF domain-containing protein